MELLYLLAFSISLITVLSLSLSTSYISLFPTRIIAFSTSFIAIYITLELLIFSQINKIYTGFNRLSHQQLGLNSKLLGTSNPFKMINKQILDYAKNKENEIKKVKKLEIYRKEFIANISHELRTPIFIAQSCIHTLLDGGISDEKVNIKFLKKSAIMLDTLNILLQDLLTLSLLESKTIIIQPSVFNLSDLIRQVIEELEEEELEEEAKKRKIQILYNGLSKKKLNVYADKHKIKQVLFNLIQNGIKYGKENGLVKISLMDERKDIYVCIKDNGVGIFSEHLDRIFEQFYRMDKSRSKGLGGTGLTGLGLAIVKHILEIHNKKIDVKSKIEKGTTFSFRLNKRDQK